LFFPIVGFLCGKVLATSTDDIFYFPKSYHTWELLLL